MTDISDEQHKNYYHAKENALERILGPMHKLMRHAIPSFRGGGSVDLYYFPNGIPGTGFATMELIEPDEKGPRPNQIGTYELVAFTKQSLPSSPEKANDHPIRIIAKQICRTFTTIALYSYDAVLNPGDTCELPGQEDGPKKYILFDEYAPDGISFEIDGKKHCLLLCLEVFQSEMEYSIENGSDSVLNKLKKAGAYPYSDLDRKPVV